MLKKIEEFVKSSSGEMMVEQETWDEPEVPTFYEPQGPRTPDKPIISAISNFAKWLVCSTCPLKRAIFLAIYYSTISWKGPHLSLPFLEEVLDTEIRDIMIKGEVENSKSLKVTGDPPPSEAINLGRVVNWPQQLSARVITENTNWLHHSMWLEIEFTFARSLNT